MYSPPMGDMQERPLLRKSICHQIRLSLRLRLLKTEDTTTEMRILLLGTASLQRLSPVLAPAASLSASPLRPRFRLRCGSALHYCVREGEVSNASRFLRLLNY